MTLSLPSPVNWVDHSKTLREQGIDESDVLLLKRKYFYSDANIDSRDPVQLNLLYEQAKVYEAHSPFIIHRTSLTELFFAFVFFLA